MDEDDFGVKEIFRILFIIALALLAMGATFYLLYCLFGIET